MVGSASISGLASGLDTASIISQLMTLEATQQNRLKSQVKTYETAVTSLQGINTKIASLTDKAEELAKASGWSPMKSTSSSEKVTVTTTTGAVPTAFSFTVGATAKAHQLTFADTAQLNDVVVSGGTMVRLDKLDGTTVDIETGDGTLGGLVNALNTSGQGVRATTVKLDDGSYRVRVESLTTGAASDFTLTNTDGSTILGGASVVAGQDAEITLGGDTIHSASNTFSNLMPGINVTLAKDVAVGTAVDLDLTTDSAAVATKVKELVDALNGVLADIDTATKAGGVGIKAGPLAGDSTLRTVRDQLMGTLYSNGGTSLSSVGIEVDRYGKFTFSEDEFKAAYDADPAAVSGLFTKATTNTGFADRLAVAGEFVSEAYDGLLSSAINGRKSTIDDLNDRIDAWDTRLELRRQTLTRQFTALETALGQMNSQSSWLAGQIASLPTY